MAIHQSMLFAIIEKDREGNIVNPYAWEYAQGLFSELQLRTSRFELNPTVVKRFADGERRPQAEFNLRKRNSYVLFDSNAYPPDWLTDILLVNQALAKSQAHEIVDVFPYMKFLRQDRKDVPRTSISARALARVVQLDGDRVITMDAHNMAIDGMYDIPLDNLSPYPILNSYIRSHPEEWDMLEGLENLIFMSPDKGGAERIEQCADIFGVSETIVGDKKRKTAGKVDRLRLAEKVEGRNIMIIDDLLDSGGTGQTCRDRVKSLGARKVIFYATAGLWTKGLTYATEGFDRVYIGDGTALPLKPGEIPPSNLRVVPLRPLIAEAIYRTNEGDPLSNLYHNLPITL